MQEVLASAPNKIVRAEWTSVLLATRLEARGPVTLQRIMSRYDVTALSRETLDRARLVRRWPKEQLQVSVLLIMTCQILPGVMSLRRPKSQRMTRSLKSKLLLYLCAPLLLGLG